MTMSVVAKSWMTESDHRILGHPLGRRHPAVFGSVILDGWCGLHTGGVQICIVSYLVEFVCFLSIQIASNVVGWNLIGGIWPTDVLLFCNVIY